MTAGSERPRQQEAYMHDYDGAITEHVIATRTAEIHAAFLLPHLRAGMDLLDCGCGPGTITLGLAQAVSPGRVTGIDVEESQLARAREKAAERGLTNVDFERGDAYELAYRDEQFDAVFSHAMLDHKREPLAILKELHRVLKPGGLIALRSVDLAATLIAPANTTLTRAFDIWLKHRQHCGGDPFIGRRLRAMLHGVGFTKTIGSSSSESWGTPEATQLMVTALMDEFTGPKITETALQMGWADQTQMDGAARALEDWGAHADAFMAILWCEAVGWKA